MTTTTRNTATSPVRPTKNSNPNKANVTPNRPRMNSRDIPRSYSGMFGEGGDMLPFEISRNWHTDWLENGGWLLLGVYIGGIILFEVIVLAVLDSMETIPLYWSWTITNAIHCLLSTLYLHWLKGSLFDDQGEMSALTLWEQLEARPKTSYVKRALSLVPTLVCYAACQFSNYDFEVCMVNIVLWTIHIISKLPIMNGVRIFGINRTTGIDDFEKEA